ncbi:MAG TPA: hypothetical protein VKT80_12545, partial [Chloroflexota bacterium]|nr:hypothetical protein [Chloroflexota bacterium]
MMPYCDKRKARLARSSQDPPVRPAWIRVIEPVRRGAARASNFAEPATSSRATFFERAITVRSSS